MSYPCQGRLYSPVCVDLRGFGEETEAALLRAGVVGDAAKGAGEVAVTESHKMLAS